MAAVNHDETELRHNVNARGTCAPLESRERRLPWMMPMPPSAAALTRLAWGIWARSKKENVCSRYPPASR